MTDDTYDANGMLVAEVPAEAVEAAPVDTAPVVEAPVVEAAPVDAGRTGEGRTKDVIDKLEGILAAVGYTLPELWTEAAALARKA